MAAQRKKPHTRPRITCSKETRLPGAKSVDPAASGHRAAARSPAGEMLAQNRGSLSRALPPIYGRASRHPAPPAMFLARLTCPALLAPAVLLAAPPRLPGIAEAVQKHIAANEIAGAVTSPPPPCANWHRSRPATSRPGSSRARTTDLTGAITAGASQAASCASRIRVRRRCSRPAASATAGPGARRRGSIPSAAWPTSSWSSARTSRTATPRTSAVISSTPPPRRCNPAGATVRALLCRRSGQISRRATAAFHVDFPDALPPAYRGLPTLAH